MYIQAFLVRRRNHIRFQINGFWRRGADLLAHNTGCVSGPGQASASVDVGRPDLDGLLNLFFDRYLLDGTCRADAAAQGAGIFAVTLRHDETGCPETGNAGFGQCRVDHIGGTDFHT